MPNADARMVRGLSIAVLILSILALAGGLLVLVLLGIGGGALGSSEFARSAAAEINSNPDVINQLNELNLSSSDLLGITAVGLGIIGALIVWSMICSAVALVASILGLRNYDKPDRLGGAFGWSVAGAVTSFLTGNIITMVLLIVSAVYIDKVRKTFPTF